ncbi:MAG: rhomboid family intramembrane serine protease [Bdellovibrionaceae bacterium]|nr:rhomboid family intramembrane serine protease [Pseudobdellovibrionaceae bacterium]
MIFIPIGLQAKIKDPPFLVAGIIVVTVFLSILNFPILSKYEKDFYNHPQRQKYFFQLRSLYIKNCDIFQKEDMCAVLKEFQKNDSIRNPLVAHSDLLRYFQALSKQKTKDYQSIVGVWQDESFVRKGLSVNDRVDALNELRIISVNDDVLIKELQVKAGVYSKKHPSVIALIKAQFIHSDWVHLIGNLIFFFFFGACLEQAVGRSWLMGIYMIGGTIGLYINQLFAPNESAIILGASANIFACAGAFLRLYWQQSLRLWFNFLFVVNKTIELPTWTFFIFFVIVQQVEGVSRGAAGVAYIAHIVGFAVGAVMAHMWSQQKKFNPNKDIIFPYEKTMIEEITNTHLGCARKIDLALDVMYYHPLNSVAYQKLFDVLTSCDCTKRCVLQEQTRFVEEQASYLLKEYLKEKCTEEAGSFYLELNNFKTTSLLLLKELTSEDIIRLGNNLYTRGYKNEVKELFRMVAEESNAEIKIVFDQFLDSLEREEVFKNVG